MSDDSDGVSTGALLLGVGVAGYALWHWLRPQPAQAAPGVPELPTPIDPYPDVEVPPATPAPSSPLAPLDEPISSPSQVEVASAPPDALSRDFDLIFDRYRGSIPVEYLRTLAKRESSMRANDRKGNGWGLMSIVEVVRRDYNEAHSTRYTRADLVDPAVNVAMCCWVLHFIIDSYRRNHPNVPNLREDWDNPRFVELLTFGWNAGFSEKAGVGKVVRYLEGLGAIDVDLDQVHAHARIAGAGRHLSNEKKVRWCKSVVALYQRERGPRNARRRQAARRRGASSARHTVFLLRTYPDGIWGPAITRWYRADAPTTWADAKRRLIAAGVLDVRVLRPTEWKLVADPPFRVPEGRAKPLPGGEP